jgi:hypothetical protein
MVDVPLSFGEDFNMPAEDVVVTPGPATVITRRQQVVTFVAGNKQVVPLTKNLFVRGVFLRLTAQPTLTGANNTVANTALGDEWGCVTKVEIIANSATVLFSASGSDLKPLMRIMGSGFLAGHNPRIQPNLGDGATANPVLDSTVFIPFINPRSRRPFDTLLFAAELSDFRLEVTFATDWTSINTAATAWTAQPQIEVYTREQSAPVGPNGKIILPQFYRRVLKTPLVFAGANPSFDKQLNTGPIYRGVVINVNNNTTQESATILTNVKVTNGATTYLDQAYNPLQAKINQDWDINEMQFAAATGIWTQSAGAVSPKAVPNAWAFVDFCEDGYMSEAIDTQAVGDTFMNFAMNAAGTVNMLTQELVRIAR